MSKDSEIVLRGGRVVLCRPAERDRPAWCELVSSSRSFLARWIEPATSADDPDGSRWFDATLATRDDPRYEKLLIQRWDGVLLGALNFNEVVRGSLQSAFLGCWLGQPHIGQGYMTEALGLGLCFAFGPMKLHRVEANIQPENEPSLNLVRAAGFSKEGFSEKYLRVGTVWRDHERWALTTENWNGQDPTNLVGK